MFRVVSLTDTSHIIASCLGDIPHNEGCDSSASVGAVVYDGTICRLDCPGMQVVKSVGVE